MPFNDMERELLEGFLEETCDILEKLDDDLVTLVYYFLGHIDGPKSDLIRDVLDELLPEPERKRVMSGAAEQWETEGFNKGIQQGRT